ncbi:transcription factor [Ganoderma sinense ZZ0214-1]|uniref:Transcription factor n=1 Tax=Ganoderma sinense ZZ0214-1 TaxID=1077348 RepID=A0A2G8RV55_9APHY|nr:transcription factor [Ganoderma sinense ZZ0214-1]
MDRPRSPPALPPTRDRTPPRSPSPPVFHPQHHIPPTNAYQNPPPHPHSHPRSDYAYSEAHSRPDSRLSDSRHHPPPAPPPQRHSASASSVTDEVTPPASPPHKRFKSENSLPPPVPCHVDQRWHYSHGPYPPPFYPYPYHHQNMPHRVEDMSVDRSISHRSDGPAQYQFMPHSHPTPPPIATLHHSPALSASSLESTSISPSPPITQPSTPYYQHPAQGPPMSQAPPYPYQPNGAMPRYPDESQPGFAPHPGSRQIRPTMVAAQPYPGQANYIIHTDDASTKLSDRVRRKCYNCRTTDTSTWRRSSLTPGKVLCNKCGLFERTHSRPRPEQFPHKRGPVVNVNQFKQHRNTPRPLATPPRPPPPPHSPSSSSSSSRPLAGCPRCRRTCCPRITTRTRPCPR